MTEPVSESEDKIYAFVHAALFKVHIAKGILETTRLLERGKAKTVILAANVSPSIVLDVIRRLCKEKAVHTVTVSDKNKLGKSVGLDVGASCIALPIEFAIK